MNRGLVARARHGARLGMLAPRRMCETRGVLAPCCFSFDSCNKTRTKGRTRGSVSYLAFDRWLRGQDSLPSIRVRVLSCVPYRPRTRAHVGPRIRYQNVKSPVREDWAL